jgi:hypothetical protein
MNKNKYWLWAGLALLLLGIIGLFFSQLIIEDWIGVERAFGEEPLSLQYTRAGGIAFLLGILLMVYGGWKNRRMKRA